MSSSPSPPDATDLATRLARRFAPARDVEPLAPDASVRRFFRVHRARGRARVALVDRDGGVAALDRMVAARDLLAAVGVRVPRVEDRDDEIPALLFEDFGDVLLADALGSMTAEQQRAAYRQAGRFAGLISTAGTARVGPDHPLATPRLGRERLRWELALFATQEIGGRRGIADPGVFGDLAEVADRICDAITATPPTLAHRDFHARNLMLLPDGSLGVLDFQDALLAPRHYDLASLVRDPYVEPAEPLARAAVEGYREAGGSEADPLGEPLFAWVALQRDLKAMGTYAFQGRWRKRERFFAYTAPAERMALLAVPHLPAEARATVQYVLKRLGFE